MRTSLALLLLAACAVAVVRGEPPGAPSTCSAGGLLAHLLGLGCASAAEVRWSAAPGPDLIQGTLTSPPLHLPCCRRPDADLGAGASGTRAAAPQLLPAADIAVAALWPACLLTSSPPQATPLCATCAGPKLHAPHAEQRGEADPQLVGCVRAQAARAGWQAGRRAGTQPPDPPGRPCRPGPARGAGAEHSVWRIPSGDCPDAWTPSDTLSELQAPITGKLSAGLSPAVCWCRPGGGAEGARDRSLHLLGSFAEPLLPG